MGIPLRPGLAVVASLLWLLCLPLADAQSPSKTSARALDVLLQDYAYRAFVRPRTGVPYDGQVPSNLTGIKIAAMRLRSGSLRKRGVKMYKEFNIPPGVKEAPYVERLVLVYQNLGNWSKRYYQLPGYTYLAPVLGLLAYDASNLSVTNLPELDIRASADPILIKFPDVKSAPSGSVAKCVRFDLKGSANLTNVASGNVCSTSQQGHFSIVVKSLAPSPPPISPPAPAPSSPPRPSGREKKGKKSSSRVGIIVGSVLGALALLVALSFLGLCASKFKRRKKIKQMEKAADVGEALHMTSVGGTKAPSATVTRTQPVLETEYVP